ncbi:MAG: phosphoribosylformylglycinamidine synthase I [bacterium]|nr:phosphoribosylformylglycinamidine synthase I [bacterium]
MVKAVVLRTAGTNCDYETRHALELSGAKTDLIHINELISNKKSLKDYQILVIAGGFSYGDDLGAGKILANKMIYRMKEQLDEFVKDKKLIIGICNGFQVLVKTGLLPGNGGQTASLTTNDSSKFECRWIRMKLGRECAFTTGMKEIIELPIAHGEGKFVADDKTMESIKQNDQIVFKYVDERGEETGYPANPNGSMESIAGICNKEGNVFGLMPHPERFLDKYSHPRWTRENIKEGDGLAIFKNAVEYAKKNLL